MERTSATARRLGACLLLIGTSFSTCVAQTSDGCDPQWAGPGPIDPQLQQSSAIPPESPSDAVLAEIRVHDHLRLALNHLKKAVKQAIRDVPASAPQNLSQLFADTSAPSDAAVEERGLSPELELLRDRVRGVLRHNYLLRVNSAEHSPWEVMHWVIAYGVDAQIRMEGPSGAPITAVGWLCYNRRSRGQQMFYPSGTGFGLQQGPGVQGHEGQLLAVLAQAHVMPDYGIKVAGKDFTVADLIEHEKATCLPRTELTFKLIGLAHYLDSNATWQSQYGESWSIERLVREELAQPIRGAACGGTHRLMGLSYAVQKRSKSGEPIVGEFQRAQVFLRDYYKYTFKLQNADGSFSTEWFRGRADSPDPERKLQTTGHILEWLAFSLPDEELTQPPTVHAVRFLIELLAEGRGRNWRLGPLGHALHALVLYDQRAFGGTPDDWRQPAAPDKSLRTVNRPPM